MLLALSNGAFHTFGELFSYKSYTYILLETNQVIEYNVMYCLSFSLYSAGRDFLSLNMSLVFLPGDTVGSPPRCVNISILNDDAVEANETFDVVVSSNSILQVTGATSVPVTINEDPTDCEPFKAVDHLKIQHLYFNRHSLLPLNIGLSYLLSCLIMSFDNDHSKECICQL